jgi:hypothetical protein
MIRETSFRKKPSNRRTNPPRKSRGIQDLLLPLATSEIHSATNHKSKASLRITTRDYTTDKHFIALCFAAREPAAQGTTFSVALRHDFAAFASLRSAQAKR